jgi:uncharacterized membrane protein YkoI
MPFQFHQLWQQQHLLDQPSRIRPTVNGWPFTGMTERSITLAKRSFGSRVVYHFLHNPNIRKTIMYKTIPLMLTATFFIQTLPAQAERIDLDQVPKAVMEGLRQEHPDASNLEVDKENHFGLTLYEVKFKEKGGHEHQTLLDTEGKPFGHEEPVDPKDLPPAVTQSLGKVFSSFKIKDVEKIHHPDGTRIEYEIDLEGDGADWEITMDSKGNVLAKEQD